MADDNDLAAIPKLISDLVVFGIQLLGNVKSSAETVVAQILRLPQVLEELQKQLNRFTQQHFAAARQGQIARNLMDAIRTPLPKKPGMSLSMRPEDSPPLGAGSTNALTQALLARVKELDGALNKGGIWYDRSTYTLYLVASGATLDRVLSLFVLNGGHFNTNLPSILASNKVKFLKLGDYSLTGEAPTFKVSPEIDKKQEPEWKTLVTANWKPVQVSFTVGSKILGDHLKVIDHGQAKAVIPIGGVKITPTVKVSHTDDKGKTPVDAGLEVSYEKGKIKIQVAASVKTSAEQVGKKPLKGDVKGGVEYKTQSGITFGVSGSVKGEATEEASRITGWEVMGTVKLAEW